MILQEASAGERYVVEAMVLPVELERRLEALGLIEGTPIDVLRKKRRGAMIVTVRGTRFAIGYGIASHIQVKKEAAAHGA